MASSKSLYFLAAVGALLIACCGTEGRTLVSFRNNMKQVNGWKCSEPKPRLVYLEKEYEEFDSGNAYLPHVAVVNRCDMTTGCCTQPGHVCTAVEEEEIDFTFQVTYPDGGKEKIEIPLKNHLMCQCKLSSNARH